MSNPIYNSEYGGGGVITIEVTEIWPYWWMLRIPWAQHRNEEVLPKIETIKKPLLTINNR